MSNDLDGNIAEIDFSVIRTAIEIGGKPIEQVLNGVHYGSPEVRCLLLDECELIIECKVCRALFRALPLFIAHKRVYCTTSFQESQPPLFETIVTTDEPETIVVQPTAPEDDIPEKTESNITVPTPEDQLNQLVEQIQAGKAGTSGEYKFYSNIAGLVERRKELGKTMNLELKTIPTNKNAVMVNVREDVLPDEVAVVDDVDVDNEVPTEPEEKGSSRLETLLTQKILPKCRNEGVIKTKQDDTTKNGSSGKNQNSELETADAASTTTTIKNKKNIVVIAAGVKPKDNSVGSMKLEKPADTEMSKSVAKQSAAVNRVSLREKKPTAKSRVSESSETDETLDLSSLKCLKCHMSYSSKKTLLYHFQMRHSQLRTFFPCPFCSNIFFYFWGLTRHMMKIHKKSKNQIDKMREKLRKRSFTKCITKSCNIAKDQLQFVADNDDDDDSNTQMMEVEKAVNEAHLASRASKQQAATNQTSKTSGPSKGKVCNAERNVKSWYVNEYQMPKIHKEPRISLKEGLRNSKDKQKDSRKAVVKRLSEPPRAKNPSWTDNADSKARKIRKSDSPKSISDEEISPRSKERALDELQKKLTEAAAVPIPTRSSSSERMQSERKNESATVVRGSETKTPTESPEKRRKPAESVSFSQVTERRPIVSGTPRGLEKMRLSSESSQGSEKKVVCSESPPSVKNTDIVLVAGGHSELGKMAVDRPGARRRQIQIGTTILPRMVTEKQISTENKDGTDKLNENAGTGNQLVESKLNTAEVSRSEVQEKRSPEGRSGGLQKSGEEMSQSTKPSDGDSDESRGRLSRRRTLTTKAQASVPDSSQRKNVIERRMDKNEKQQENKDVDKNEKTENEKVLPDNKQEKKNVGKEDNKMAEKIDNQEKKKVKPVDKSGGEETAGKVCRTDHGVSGDKGNKEEHNSESDKSSVVKPSQTQSKSVTKDRIQKIVGLGDIKSSISQGNDRQLRTGPVNKGHLHDNCASTSGKESEIKTCKKIDDVKESELSAKQPSSRSSSVERSQRSKDSSSTEVKFSPKEAKLADLKDVGETTMRLFASPPGSKPLIKHSRIKKTNEFVVRCVPHSVSVSEVAKSSIAGNESETESKSETKPESKSETKTESKSETKSETKAESKSETKNESKSETKNESKSTDESSLDKSKGQNKVPERNLVDDDEESVKSIADDDSVVSSEDNTNNSSERLTPRLHRFRCGCGRKFSCKVGFANHRRACDAEGAQIYLKVSETSAKSEADMVSTSGDKSDSCSVTSHKEDAASERKNVFVCHCGKGFNVKVGLSNHQRACINPDAKNVSETGANKEKNINTNSNSHSGDGKTSESKSIFSMQSSFELFSCDKCNRVFGRKVSFVNHQQNCTETKPEKGDNSNKVSNKSGNSVAAKNDTPIKTSSTRRKFVARKLSASRNDPVDSDDGHSAKKSSTNLKYISPERRVKPNEHHVSYMAPHRKRSNSVRSEISDDSDHPPEKQVRVIEEIWVDKVPGKPVEKVKSNRIYVMGAEGSGKLHCQDTKKLCDIADEGNMKCLVCLQEFTSVSNLRRHAIRHLGWKRYKCKMCRFSSYNKSECNTHIIRTHSEKLRSAAATEYMIVDLNKEACRVRTEKKKQTLSDRKASEMGGASQMTPSRRRQREKEADKTPEDRKKPAVREENIRNPVPHNTFNISTRNSPRKFDTRPYRKVDQLATLCTRKSYYLKADQLSELNKNKKNSGSVNSVVNAETAGGEKTDESPAKQKRMSSGSSQENVDGKKIDVENVLNVGDQNGGVSTERVEKMDDIESMSDTESFTRSKKNLIRKHRSSNELKDTGYASDSCLARCQSPGRSHSKTKSVSSDSSVQKHRKLSGGSSSSEKSMTPLGSGSRPLTMMSIQDMFELIKPKPKPERKSVGDTPTKPTVKVVSPSDLVVRRVSLEGSVVTRKQADSVSQTCGGDKDRTTGTGRAASSKGGNQESCDATQKTSSRDGV